MQFRAVPKKKDEKCKINQPYNIQQADQDWIIECCHLGLYRTIRKSTTRLWSIIIYGLWFLFFLNPAHFPLANYLTANFSTTVLWNELQWSENQLVNTWLIDGIQVWSAIYDTKVLLTDDALCCQIPALKNQDFLGVFFLFTFLWVWNIMVGVNMLNCF
jgi:hypothetical protein